jgi:hypothetical protein
MKTKWLFLVIIIMMSGCTGINHKTLNLKTEDREVSSRDFLIEPAESLGLEVTPALKTGRVSVYQGIMHDMLLGEGATNRLRWNGLGVSETGQIYFIQVLRWPPNQLDLNGYGRLRIVVEDGGKYRPVKLLYFSSAVHYGYDVFGEKEVKINSQKMLDNLQFCREFILQNGTDSKELRRISRQDFYSDLKRWESYTTPDGSKILTPLAKKQVQEIAGLNPQYSVMQKWVGNGRKMISPNLYATAIANTLEVANAVWGDIPPKGWSLDSVITRRQAVQERRGILKEMRRLIQFWRNKALQQNIGRNER